MTIISHQGYEKRYYAPATFVCNNVTGIDTAADPLAGLDDMNPFEIMGSKRYKKRHESQMFMELFRYIAGVNQVDSALIMNKKRIKNILEARKNRDDKTCGRLPQRDEGDAPRKLRGPLYVFLPSLQVPG